MAGYADVIDGLADGEETVGFLVWGDPAFYDSTVRVVVVMLDGHLRCGDLVGRYPELELCCGAHLGSADEVLVAGPLAAVIGAARRVRTAARARHGWVMDTYLLRPPTEARARAGRRTQS